MLGRLIVERRSVLGARMERLDRVPVGNSVSVTATVAGMSPSRGRVVLVLEDGQGGSASVGVDSAKVVQAFRDAGMRPRPGVRVQLHGAVTEPIVSLPKGIAVTAIRVVA